MKEIFLSQHFNIIRLCVGSILPANGQHHLGRLIGLAGFGLWTVLLEYWADSHMISHISIAQRTQVAIILAHSVDYIDLTERDVVIANVSVGFRNHFRQSASDCRDIGMATAEKIIKKFDPNSKLDFEIQSDNLVADMKDFPQDDPVKTKEFLKFSREKFLKEEVFTNTQLPEDDDVASLDSDDLEFEQFDFETPNLSKYSPRFLLEASGILAGRNLPVSCSESEKVNRKIAALEQIPHLAKVNTEASKEIVDELLSGIIYCDTHNRQDAKLVVEALISLAVAAPVNFAPAMSELFYQENLCLEKRQLILSALSKAISEISENPIENMIKNLATGTSGLSLSAKVESQTRRWRSKPAMKDKEITSKFYPVAGSFLFPFLAKWDRNKRTLLLETNDKDILSRMIAYVGQIIGNLENSPELQKHVLPSIDFLATFRRLDDLNIKLTVLRSYNVCIISLGTRGMSGTGGMEFTWRQWLEECCFTDHVELSIAARELLDLFQ